MTIEDRIKSIEDYLNTYYGECVCNGSLINIRSNNGKIVICYNNGSAFVRERRSGRGIQIARIINLINKDFKPEHGKFTDKTIIIGKEE